MSETYARPVNYFEGDRVRITADALMKAQTWVGRTGTVTKGSGRSFNEGVSVRLDRPIGRYDNIWFRHSEVEFEDNMMLMPVVYEVGDYVKTLGSPVSCVGDGNGLPWMQVTKRAFAGKDLDMHVRCISADCGWHDVIDIDEHVVSNPRYMCDQPALPDGSYHADLPA